MKALDGEMKTRERSKRRNSLEEGTRLSMEGSCRGSKNGAFGGEDDFSRKTRLFERDFVGRGLLFVEF